MPGSMQDKATLRNLRERLRRESGSAARGVVDSLKPEQTPPGDEASHKFRTAIKFVLSTVVLGGAATYISLLVTSCQHENDVQLSKRANAITAVAELSDLTDERRERGAMVISSIRRAATEAETVARKTAYDEAYVRWNSKVPGDLLRIRAGLDLEFRSLYLRSIDGLTDANKLDQPDEKSEYDYGNPRPGLLTLMDTCITNAFDTYRTAKFQSSETAMAVVNGCAWHRLYDQSVSCFSAISDSLYSAVSSATGVPSEKPDMRAIRTHCDPPPQAPAAPVSVERQATSEQPAGK